MSVIFISKRNFEIFAYYSNITYSLVLHTHFIPKICKRSFISPAVSIQEANRRFLSIVSWHNQLLLPYLRVYDLYLYWDLTKNTGHSFRSMDDFFAMLNLYFIFTERFLYQIYFFCTISQEKPGHYWLWVLVVTGSENTILESRSIRIVAFIGLSLKR